MMVPALAVLLIIACIGAGHAVIEQFKESREKNEQREFNRQKREHDTKIKHLCNLLREAELSGRRK